MSANLILCCACAVAAAVIGGAAGGLAVWHLNRTEAAAEPACAELPLDPFVEAQLDIAATKWAEANNQPPAAAHLMAIRLKTLYDLNEKGDM